MHKYNKRQVSMQLIELARKMYNGRDKSHGILHVIKVRENALNICKKLNINDINILLKIETASLFHDLWDHKYIDKNSKDYMTIKKNLYTELKKNYFSEHDIKEIEIIINNISLSREINLRKENNFLNLKHLQLMRDIVSDSDKLEMLGLQGIDRIVEYQLYKFPDCKSDEIKKIVKDVYNKKISILLSDNYIKTGPGREMAIPLMQEIKNYIEMIN